MATGSSWPPIHACTAAATVQARLCRAKRQSRLVHRGRPRVGRVLEPVEGFRVARVVAGAGRTAGRWAQDWHPPKPGFAIGDRVAGGELGWRRRMPKMLVDRLIWIYGSVAALGLLLMVATWLVARAGGFTLLLGKLRGWLGSDHPDDSGSGASDSPCVGGRSGPDGGLPAGGSAQGGVVGPVSGGGSPAVPAGRCPKDPEISRCPNCDQLRDTPDCPFERLKKFRQPDDDGDGLTSTFVRDR